ncbi:MAG TPA: hypothetical protein VG187_07055 [Mycobacterium sp.]|nr:hypothetical protein [Mycobacterium sp.]
MIAISFGHRLIDVDYRSRLWELMREPAPQPLEQTLDFVHAHAELHQVPRRRGAVGVELLIRGPRYAVREFV